LARGRGQHWGWWARLSFLFGGLQVVVFGVLPVLVTVAQFQALVRGHVVAVDFRDGPWVAGHRLLSGLTPYVGPHSAQLQGITFVYPAAAAILLAPFSLLSQGAAGTAFTFVTVAAALLTLRVLDVKDWRVYGVALMWPEVVSAWETANVTLLLGLAMALAWRYRDRPVVAGGLVALAISAKPFVWPLALWLVATRRYRALGFTLGLGVAINVLAWAAVGFDQISRYAALMSTLAKNQENRGYSLVAMVLNRGGDRLMAYGLLVGVTAIVAGACLVAGRRRGGRPAFALAIAACLVTSPMSWLHYFALLVIPLALARPRLSTLWLVPLLFQLPAVGASTRQTTMMFGLAAVIIAKASISIEPDPLGLKKAGSSLPVDRRTVPLRN
jgi:Glycosyltransferase family 87